MYDGYFHQGKKEGQGTYKYYNGDIYIGEWVSDKKEGHGKYIYKVNSHISTQFYLSLFLF